MKLVRFGKPGREKPGIIDEEGQIRDLSTKLKDIDSKAINSNSLKVRAWKEKNQMDTIRLVRSRGYIQWEK